LNKKLMSLVLIITILASNLTTVFASSSQNNFVTLYGFCYR